MSACMPLNFVQVSSSGTFSLVKTPRVMVLLTVFTLFYCATSRAVQSTVGFVK